LKDFFLRHKKLHLWLLTNAVLLAAFFLLQNQRGFMTDVSEVMAVVRRGLAAVCYLVPVSVAELLVVLLVAAAVVYVIWSVAAIVRAKGRRLHRLYSALLGAVCSGVTIYTAFCWLWGFSFYIDGFQEKSGVYAQDVAVADLRAVTELFVEGLQKTADSVPRDENGIFAAPWQEILEDSAHTYDNVEKIFPALAFDDQPPKAVYFSRILSRLDFTGIFCPYTGEANVNVDSPAAFLPATAAHELAHQRGFSSEQECNFIAIAASTTADDPVTNYSGWLLGYVYLGNALHSADRAAWEEVYDALPVGAKLDLIDNNEYWDQFEDTVVQQVSNTVYDGLLKSYGEEKGIQSYGTVVDMLVAYYKEQIS